MFSINNILFTVGGNGVSLLELLCVITGLSCVVLAGRNSKYNFWFGYVYNILLFIMFLQKNLYSAMLLQPLSLANSLYGHWRWTHPKEEERSASDSKSLKVSTMTWAERGMALLTVIICSAIWGFVLGKLGTDWFTDTFSLDPQPYLDAFLLMLTLMAQYLSALKKWDCWIVWIFVNITNITLYISTGLVFMPIVSALYLLNGIWSLWTWYRLYQKNQ